MFKLFNDILTGKDNNTYDLVKFGIFIAIFLVVGDVVIEALKGHDINLMEVAGYFATILGIGAGAIKIKETTEPGN